MASASSMHTTPAYSVSARRPRARSDSQGSRRGLTPRSGLWDVQQVQVPQISDSLLVVLHDLPKLFVGLHGCLSSPAYIQVIVDAEIMTLATPWVYSSTEILDRHPPMMAA